MSRQQDPKHIPKEAVSQPETEGLKQAQDVRVRLVGVIHPFFVTHNLRNEHGIERILARTAENVREKEYAGLEEEIVSAKKMLERVRQEAGDPSATLVYVSSEIHLSDYDRIRETMGNKVFNEPPSTPLDKSRDNLLLSLGIRAPFDESWLLAQSLRAFTPERVLYSYKNVNQEAIYENFHEKATKSTVAGIFMGSYSGQCVSNNRNMVCEALNIPYSRVAVGKSQGVDAWWPLTQERELMQADFLTQAGRLSDDPDERDKIARGFYRTWARGEVRNYRDQALVEGSGYTILNRAFIKTYLKPENQKEFEKIFGKYRVEELARARQLAGEAVLLGEEKPNFPPRADAAAEISFYLHGWKWAEPNEAGGSKPWEASVQEVRQFRLKLASYLAGREVGQDALREFSHEYDESLRFLTRSGNDGNLG